jgi:hypothetical protein
MSGARDDGSIKSKQQTAERADDGGFQKWGVQFISFRPLVKAISKRNECAQF